MKKKILVVYATAGVGHKKAALAIYGALRREHEDIEVELVDVLKYTNLFFRETYCAIYLFLVNRLTFLWGFFYYFFNCKPVHYLFLPLRRAGHIFNSFRFVRFLLEYDPDVVISTHFIAPDVCDYLKLKYKKSMHVVNVITDYRPHSFWVSKGVDTYAVGHLSVKEELMARWKVPAESIKVTGIPIEEKFSKGHDRVFLREKFGIGPDRFAMALLSGGYGVGPVVDIVKSLNRANFPMTAIAVCGHNSKLYRELEKFKKGARIQIINFGFVDNINELIALSDICAGKAGGISTSEAFAVGTPFVFVKPIPGQESANARLFVKVGAGLRLGKVSDVLKVVEELYKFPERMRILTDGAKHAGKPHAAREVANFASRISK